MFLNFVLYHLINNAFWKCLRLRKSTWNFWEVNFRSRDFVGFCWKPLGFWGLLIFAPIPSSNLEYTPPTAPPPLPLPSSVGVSSQCVTRSQGRLLCHDFGTAANSANINKKYLFILRTFVQFCSTNLSFIDHATNLLARDLCYRQSLETKSVFSSAYCYIHGVWIPQDCR